MCLSHQVVGSLGSLKQAARRALARSLLRYGGRVGRAGRASRGECGACEACRAEASPLSTVPSRNCGSETARSPRLPSPRRAAPRARRPARRAVCDTLSAGCVASPRGRERGGVVVRVWRVVSCAEIAARPLARHAPSSRRAASIPSPGGPHGVDVARGCLAGGRECGALSPLVGRRSFLALRAAERAPSSAARRRRVRGETGGTPPRRAPFAGARGGGPARVPEVVAGGAPKRRTANQPPNKQKQGCGDYG